MGSADESETYYDSLDEDSVPAGIGESSRLAEHNSSNDALNGVQRNPPLEVTLFSGVTACNCCQKPTHESASECTCARDMETLTYALCRLKLEDSPTEHTSRSDLHQNRSARRTLRRSKSCTSLGKSSNVSKKRPSVPSKLRVDSLTSFKSKCNSYLEMYHRRKSNLGARNVKQLMPERYLKCEAVKCATSVMVDNEEESMPNFLVDHAPPPTSRTQFSDDFSHYLAEYSSRINPSLASTRDNFDDIISFKVLPDDTDQYISKSLNAGEEGWKQKKVAPHSATETSVKYVPYSIKDYKTLQVPKLGSLGYDREAVREKYERMRKQRTYGIQASVRNRSKITLPTAASDKKPAKAAPPEKSNAKKQQGEKHKITRKHQRQKPVAKQTSSAKNDICDLEPLVERHLNEMRVSASILQNFKCL